MSTRFAYLLGFIVVCLLLLTSVYLQVFEGVIPCPLCTLQRLSFGLLGILFLIGIFFSSKRFSVLFISFLSALTAILGISLAGRQIWLQHFATDGSNECGVSVQYMLQVLPLNEVIKKIFAGSAECTQRGWVFLHLNMAEWALIWFVFFLFLTGYLFGKELMRRKR